MFEVGGATPGDAHALRLFENPGHGNDWISLRLVGVKTNRAAIGARITVTVENAGARTRRADPSHGRQRRIVRRLAAAAAHRAGPRRLGPSTWRSGGRPATPGSISPTSARTRRSRSRSSRQTTPGSSATVASRGRREPGDQALAFDTVACVSRLALVLGALVADRAAARARSRAHAVSGMVLEVDPSREQLRGLA